MATKQQKSKFREYFEAILIALVLALLIRGFVVQAFKIPSGSMIPTLSIGDHILVSKFVYGIKLPFTDSRFLILRQPRRGDIIVFSFPGNREKEECKNISGNIAYRLENVLNNRNPLYLFKNDCRDFIKRVVGVGGDKIEIKDKQVFVNDIALDEPYKIHKARGIENGRDNFGTVTVPHGKVFVMGDNRDYSYDSRFWGFVDMDDIKGSAFIIYWSWDKTAKLFNKLRWNRVGKLLE